MNYKLKSGKIITTGKLHERAFYDVSNNRITAQFDGRGGISKYAVMNKFSVFTNYYSMYTVDGVPFDYMEDKVVTMEGKRQITEIEHEKCKLTITQFLDNESNAIYVETAVEAKQDIDFDNTVNFGINYESYVQQLLANRLSPKTIATVLTGFIKSKKNGLTFNGASAKLHGDVLGDFYIDFAISEGAQAGEAERGFHNQFSYGAKLRAGELRKFRYVVSAGTRNDFTFCDVTECLNKFDVAAKEAQKYIDDLVCPDCVKGDDFMETYYKSLLNCSISNYKELGKFKGFLAGIVYQFPARTYYRDAYWTVLSVLPVRPKLVRNEIVTLGNGINKKGECPSAVKFNFKNYWGNHYDSPSFFVAMIYDYVVHTGDLSVLSESCACGTIIEAAKLVLDRLEQETDSTGLLVKGGEYNRRDWCDNVFRSTEEKGYYVNYKSKEFTEDNLSIDTVVAVLFGIADEERSKRVLENMEKMLESKNNKQQKAGDFGTLSVYPFYKNTKDIVQKSSLPYYYHNGGDWPYLSCVYAYAKLMYGMDYKYPLTRWFEYNLDQGNYTPVEFFSPVHPQGSLLQAWSSTGAFVLSYNDGNFFRKQLGDKRVK